MMMIMAATWEVAHTWNYKAVGGDPRHVAFKSRKQEVAEKSTTQHNYLQRNYPTSKAASDFQQIVSFLEDVIHNIALLQYKFKGEEHPLQAKLHGNRKHSSGHFFPPTRVQRKE